VRKLLYRHVVSRCWRQGRRRGVVNQTLVVRTTSVPGWARIGVRLWLAVAPGPAALAHPPPVLGLSPLSTHA
jgi:hypothetical protein